MLILFLFTTISIRERIRQLKKHLPGRMQSGLLTAPDGDGPNDISTSPSPVNVPPPTGGEFRPLLRHPGNGYSSLDNIQSVDVRHDAGVPTETRINVETPPPSPLAEGGTASPLPLADGGDGPFEVKFVDERLKTLIAFLFMACCMVCTTTALAIVHDRLPDVPPLPDLVFDWVPQWDLGLPISEYLLIASMWTAIFLMIFHRYRWIVYRRLFMIVGLLYLGRSVTMLVTALPVANTDYYCSPKMNHTSVLVILERIGMLLSGLGLSVNGRHIYCGDYIYSGHTCVLVLSALVVTEYAPRKFLPLMVGVYLMAMTGIVMVSISRGHYTVDIILAYYITTRTFWMYHTIICHVELKKSGSTNFLSRVWWFRILQYFEANVPEGRLPKHFSWPLPFPARWQEHRWDYTE
ncbi:phosphatidylcholine:ceramide cholinephosphotransferase 2-like [Paramacrobiotus metropolitanus]|uniref:phosphatidylcholine:ceramide cholinephosphotransferase 2-like n=1 Tax=Paramacrobiotus metropolitanus TaxID=2943436 RepID=UPI002445702C|nr:phosphatidylcholine:ceramide cholinephosphotransferase 2-like [Paramacrobiotus metropolitanus]